MKVGVGHENAEKKEYEILKAGNMQRCMSFEGCWECPPPSGAFSKRK